MLTNDILKLIKNPNNKILLEVGAHDDTETIKLAKYFKKVYSLYEFSKIPERESRNIIIKKTPFANVLKNIKDYDVLLIENEFHHFPDIMQMWTYDYLQKNHELLIVEWNGLGNVNKYYKCFQNCEPLSQITIEIMNKFIKEKRIILAEKVVGRDEYSINSEEELVKYFKFMLPDHWRFGEKDFMTAIKEVNYPINLWEGYNIFKIKKN